MEPPNKKGYTVQRISGYLHKVIPIFDSTGKIISHAVKPLKVEVRRRDIMQIVVGASILSVPVAFTQETWDLGRDLPALNLIVLGIISLLFLGLHVYFAFYRQEFRNHVGEYFKRVIAIYLLSFAVVAILLTVIGKAPWQDDFTLAIKRTIIVTFPASMSAALSDSID